MRMVACTTVACRLEVLFENEWGTICSRGFQETNGPALCKTFGFTKGGAAVTGYGGGQGPVSAYACTAPFFGLDFMYMHFTKCKCIHVYTFKQVHVSNF
jgi:hypothetical protein